MGIHMETTDAILDTASYCSGRMKPQYFGAMDTPGEYYTDTVHTIAINTMETEFGQIIEPIPITLKTYKPFHVHQIPVNAVPANIYGVVPQQTISSYMNVPRAADFETPSTSQIVSPKEMKTKSELIKAPPKKKWIKEYLEEEPKAPASPVSLHMVTAAVAARSNGVVNGVVRPSSPVAVPPCQPLPPATAPAQAPAAAAPDHTPAPAPASLLDFAQEHSRPRTTSISHGSSQVPSPPSVGSSGSGSGGSAPRAGTREVHNKLEKNRRAHLKECFELLKRQLPATPDDKKCSNLSILGSAIRYIQVLRRKERECEHEMERLAREKIAAQQRLAALKREVTVRATTIRPLPTDPIADDKIREEPVNGHVLGINLALSPPRPVEAHTLNLSTKLRTLPVQITPTTSQQIVRTSYGRHNTLTLTTLAPAESTPHQNGHTLENGVTNGLTTLVHPAQIHLPISQVVSSSGLVVSPAALHLLSGGGGLRVLQAPHTTSIHKPDNGLIAATPHTTEGSMVVNGMTPIMVSQSTGAHLLQTHTLTHKMVETQMVKGSVAPLTVSAQYLSSTTIVKPVVVVSNTHTHT